MDLTPHYETLGLSPGASLEEVRRAYLKLVRRYPPEHNPVRFARIKEAYEQIRSLGYRLEHIARQKEFDLSAVFSQAERVDQLPPPPVAPPPLRFEDWKPLLHPLKKKRVLETLRHHWKS
jgi:curved DNA-binding protein CbpA